MCTWHVKTQARAILLGIAVLLLLLATTACSGSRTMNEPGASGNTPQVEQTKTPTGPFPIALPSQVYAKLRGVKQASSLLTRDASDYVAGFSQRVNPIAPEAIYSPAWVDGRSAFDTVSYAIYRFDLTARTGKLGIHTQWTQGMADKNLLWIGASNWTKDRWDWRNGDPTGVVDTGTEGMGLYKHPATSEMYVAVVVLGQSSALLRKVWLTCSLRGDWWMYGREPSHASCSPVVGPDSPALKWQFTLPNRDHLTQPAYDADGVVYFGASTASQDRKLYALNADGTEKWVQPVTALGISSPSWGSPCIGDDGTIYYALCPGPLYAFSRSGVQKWAYYGRQSVMQDPAIGPDGTVYVISSAGEQYIEEKWLHAVTPGGALKWEYHLGFIYATSPAIAADGTIYLSGPSSQLLALNPDGSLKWAYTAAATVTGELAVGSDGSVYFADTAKGLYAVKEDGSLSWFITLPGDTQGYLALGRDGSIYLACSDGYLHAFNADGVLRWSYYIASVGGGCPSVDSEGNVFLSSSDSRLYCLSSDGVLKWWLATPGVLGSQPILAEDGTVYLSAKLGNMYAIGPGVHKPTYTASGYVKEEGTGIGIAGVMLTITGQEPVLTDTNGFWNKGGLPDGSYIIAPLKEGYTFVPQINLVQVNGGDLAVADFTGSIANPPVWPMVGMDRAHNRRSPHTGPASATLLWSLSLSGESLRTEPMIGSDDTIYLISRYGTLYALNPDGTERWRQYLGASMFSTPAIGPDQTVYACVPNLVYALLPSGDYKWSYYMQSAAAGPVIIVGGAAVIGDASGGVVALNPDGMLAWSYYIGGGGSPACAPAVANDGTIYYGNAYNEIFALNADGTPQWAFPVDPGDLTSVTQTTAAIAADGTVYIGMLHALYAINPDGSQKWKYGLNEFQKPNSAPAIAVDGTVYICIVGSTTADNLVLAINPDGSLKWSYYADGYDMSSSPVIDAASDIFLGVNGHGFFIALHPDGTLKWTFDTSAQIYGGPAMGADGTLYFGDDTGHVYALGPGAG
jgi:large repetitive protein